MQSSLSQFGAGDVLGGRYRLADDIRVRPTAQIWRGYDERLCRPVSIRLVATDTPRAQGVRQAAIRAAGVEHRSLLPVLDIVADGPAVAIVSEWTDLPTLSYLARDPLDPRRSVDIVWQVGQALIALADAGLSHGRLHPNVVHLDGIGQVKLRGFQVDAAMHLREPDQAAWQAADAAELVGLLYLCLTGTWPEDLGDGATSTAIARIPPPSRLVADIPTNLDELVTRGLRDAAAGTADTRTLVAALAVAREELATRTAARQRRERTITRGMRIATAAVVVTAVAGVTMVGITQASQDRAPSDGTAIALDTDDGRLSSATDAGGTEPLGHGEKALPVVGMFTLDPDGDGTEYPHLLSNVIDGDPGTAWTTKSYFTADVGGKRGVGVVFDLGRPHAISAIDLELTGTSTDFTVAVGDYPQGQLEDFFPVADVHGAGDSVFVRIPRAAESRAVLIWITKMSETSDSSWDTGYRAGIRSATLYGGAEDGGR
ncbi:MAG: hypothetical protein QG597_402 [Actinomycetota bacterium]|nr:hypothetical protein [Actinomycetota bacterium]